MDKPYCPQAKYTAYGQPFGSGLNHLAKILSLMIFWTGYGLPASAKKEAPRPCLARLRPPA